jgi:hypothetical protein
MRSIFCAVLLVDYVRHGNDYVYNTLTNASFNICFNLLRGEVLVRKSLSGKLPHLRVGPNDTHIRKMRK